jgi:hypothetical protein
MEGDHKPSRLAKVKLQQICGDILAVCSDPKSPITEIARSRNEFPVIREEMTEELASLTFKA